jgi:hypothetical protein
MTARVALSVWFGWGYCRRHPAINKRSPTFGPQSRLRNYASTSHEMNQFVQKGPERTYSHVLSVPSNLLTVKETPFQG